MRIALVGPAHPYKGGGALHTTELAHRLAAAGHDVVIESWHAQYPGRLYPGQQTLDALEGRPYPRTRRKLAWYRPGGWYAEGRRLRSADLVVFALLTPLQVPPYLAMLGGLGRGPGRPRTVVICHNVLPHERRRGDEALARTLLSRVDMVLVHSAAQAAQARELAPDAPITVARMPPHLPAAVPGLPAAPAADHEAERAAVQRSPGGTTIPLGEAPPPRTPLAVLAHGALPPPVPPGPPATGGTHHPGPPLGGTRPPVPASCRLLFFGIVRPYKGLDVLLQAMAQAPADVTLTVAGEFWGGTAETEKLIADLGLAGRVTLRPGYVPAAAIPALFAAADALVMPYREASASQNALLGFSRGVPVITTTAGALAEAVRDGVDGLTCAPGDPGDLLRAIKEISDPETAARLRAGITAVDPDPCWTAYLETLIDHHGPLAPL